MNGERDGKAIVLCDLCKARTQDLETSIWDGSGFDRANTVMQWSFTEPNEDGTPGNYRTVYEFDVCPTCMVTIFRNMQIRGIRATERGYMLEDDDGQHAE